MFPSCLVVHDSLCWNMCRFSSDHAFEKPNDRRSLDLMNRCAMHVMHEFGDVVYSYGQSDEFRWEEFARYSRVCRGILDYFHFCLDSLI